MRPIDKYFEAKVNSLNEIVIIKSGVFCVAFNEDAHIMSYLFNYKIKEINDYKLIGFPNKNLEKVINKLKILGLAYVTIIDNTTHVSKRNNITESKYKRLLKKSANVYEVSSRIKNIMDKLYGLKTSDCINDILNQIEKII